jgi:hypothetical protein
VGLPHRNYSVFKQAAPNKGEEKKETHPPQWVGLKALNKSGGG